MDRLMNRKLVLVACILILTWLSASAVVPATAQDPFGRDLNRGIQTEALDELEKDLKLEKRIIDRQSLERRESRALALIIFQAGEVILKVRHGGAATIGMRGVRFQLEPSEENEKWAIAAGSFEPPTKRRSLKVSVTPPGQTRRTAVCEGAKKIEHDVPVVFTIIPLGNGDLYCPLPLVVAES